MEKIAEAARAEVVAAAAAAPGSRSMSKEVAARQAATRQAASRQAAALESSHKSSRMSSASRDHLKNLRVVQHTLVYVVGLPCRMAESSVLKDKQHFGQYGNIIKVVVNRKKSDSSGRGDSAVAYITFERPSQAAAAIAAVDNVVIDGRQLRASYGTTKYCHQFLQGRQCNSADCLYLHEVQAEQQAFTKEEMHSTRAFQELTQPRPNEAAHEWTRTGLPPPPQIASAAPVTSEPSSSAPDASEAVDSTSAHGGDASATPSSTSVALAARSARYRARQASARAQLPPELPSLDEVLAHSQARSKAPVSGEVVWDMEDDRAQCLQPLSSRAFVPNTVRNDLAAYFQVPYTLDGFIAGGLDAPTLKDITEPLLVLRIPLGDESDGSVSGSDSHDRRGGDSDGGADHHSGHAGRSQCSGRDGSEADGHDVGDDGDSSKKPKTRRAGRRLRSRKKP